jgi:SAM-dependent methyltransferase
VDCRLCGSPDLRVLFAATRSGRQVVRCRGCGFLFYDPQPSPAQAAALYSGEYFEREYPAETGEAQTRLAHRRLARIETETGVGSLLDVGCGTGRFLAVARERGWKAAGLDVSPAAARLAAAASRVPVHAGDLAGPLPPGQESVDVVTMWDILEHLADPVAALAQLPRWLTPGGLLVVQTQNANSVTAAWMGRRWEQFVEFHLCHFSSRTLRRALEGAAFEAVRIEDVDRFAAPGRAETPAPARGLRAALGRLRDRALVLAGCDAFNVMVATARAPERWKA